MEFQLGKVVKVEVGRGGWKVVTHGGSKLVMEASNRLIRDVRGFCGPWWSSNSVYLVGPPVELGVFGLVEHSWWRSSG